MKTRRAAAFTLLEMLISTGIASVLGGILYVVATEGVTSFARNASVNRSYNEARSALDRIAGQMQTAGQAPVLVDANGSAITNASQAQGVRFYRYGSLPSFQIPSGSTADAFVNIRFTKYQTAANSDNIVQPGDLATIPLIGFQATIVSISNYIKNADGSGSMQLNFTPSVTTNFTTVGDGCVPALPVDLSTKKRIETSFVPVALINNPSPQPPTPAQYYTCVIFRQVAYVAVPNNASDPTAGAQLRYYPQAMSTGAATLTTLQAAGGLSSLNSTTAFNNPKNYDVVANLYGGSVVATPTVTPLQPFQLLTNTGVSTLTTTICERSVDSSNRTATASGNISLNTNFCLMRSTAASRCPSNLVR